MHKFFAKTLFLGKKVVFLPQCHSTNAELAKRAKELGYPEGTIVYTDYQKSGRGQRGNIWEAEPGKNILMSVLLNPKFLEPKNQYYLNLIAGLAIVDTVKEFISHRHIQLKWPNDVYIEDKKIAGVLVESNLRGVNLESSIVGIGLNINQQNFDVPTATSMKLAFGSLIDIDREAVLENLLHKLEGWYLKLKNGQRNEIRNSYHELLMWRGESHEFKSESGLFTGEIVGVNEFGKLAIRVGAELRIFDVKEVVFVG